MLSFPFTLFIFRFWSPSSPFHSLRNVLGSTEFISFISDLIFEIVVHSHNMCCGISSSQSQYLYYELLAGPRLCRRIRRSRPSRIIALKVWHSHSYFQVYTEIVCIWKPVLDCIYLIFVVRTFSPSRLNFVCDCHHGSGPVYIFLLLAVLVCLLFFPLFPLWLGIHSSVTPSLSASFITVW